MLSVAGQDAPGQVSQAADGPNTVEVRGSVRDARGDPLDSFTLTVYRAGGDVRSRPYRQVAGRLEADLGHDARFVALSAPGMATHIENVASRRPVARLDLGEVRLTRGRTIGGRVLDGETGQAVAGVRVEHVDPVVLRHVTYDDSDWRPSGFAETTDLDGAFRLHGLPIHGLGIVVLAEDYRRRVVSPGPDTNDFNIAVYPRAVVEGALLTDDGAPAIGRVHLQHQRSGVGRLTWGRTDIVLDGWFERVNEDGYFRFEDLESGSYRLGAESLDGAVEERIVTIGEEGLSQWVGLTAERRGRISGSISGLAEDELVTVAVRGAGWREVPWPMDVEELGNGAYSVMGVPNGPVTVLATARSAATMPTARSVSTRTLTRVVEVVAGEGWLDFDFSFRSRVWGEVRAGSEPLAGVTVEAVPSTAGAPSAEGKTDNEGRYELEGLADGTYVVHVSRSYGPGRAVDIELAGQMMLDIRFGTASIAGKVHVAPPGQPPRKLYAVSGDGSTHEVWTDHLGGYLFEGLDEGSYTVRTNPRLHADFPTVTLDDGETASDVDLWVTASETRPIGVVDAASGERLPSASVALEDGPFAGMSFFVSERMGLPATLAGHRLAVWRAGYRKTPLRWDGDATEVKLVPLTATGASGGVPRAGRTVGSHETMPAIDHAEVDPTCASVPWTTTVTVVEPGGSAEVVERHLVRPLENELFNVAGIDEVRSSASAGRGKVVIEATAGADVVDGIRQAVRRVGARVPSATIDVLVDTACGSVRPRVYVEKADSTPWGARQTTDGG